MLFLFLILDFTNGRIILHMMQFTCGNWIPFSPFQVLTRNNMFRNPSMFESGGTLQYTLLSVGGAHG